MDDDNARDYGVLGNVATDLGHLGTKIQVLAGSGLSNSNFSLNVQRCCILSLLESNVMKESIDDKITKWNDHFLKTCQMLLKLELL